MLVYANKFRKETFMSKLLPEEQTYLQESFLFWDKILPADRERILEAAIVHTYASGDLVKQASEECSGLLLLKSGQLRAFLEGEGGKEITLYRLLSMDLCILSAPCVLKSITFDVSLEAEKESVVIHIPARLWGDLVTKYPSVQSYSMDLINSRFSEVMWVLDQLISKNLGQRVSGFLKEQALLEDSDTIHVTHETIANNLGTAREVVSRTLKYFESEGAIALSRGSIRILRPDKLLM